MTEYTPKPIDTSDLGWLRWVNTNYPFDPEWRDHLLQRKPSERPREGSPESLDDLRGLEDRATAALLAAQWWRIFEHGDEIAEAKRQDRDTEWQKKRTRLVRLGKQALDGKLGDTREQCDDARATAQTYLRQSPEHCSDDDLRDWEKMHRYAKKIASGLQVNRPRLAADLRREAEQRRSVADMDDAIGAAQYGRPQPKREQTSFGGGWR